METKEQNMNEPDIEEKKTDTVEEDNTAEASTSEPETNTTETETTTEEAKPEVKDNEPVATTNTAVKKFKRNIIIAVILVLGLVIVAPLVISLAVFYSGGDDTTFEDVENKANNGLVAFMIDNLNYPVADVSGTKITYSEFIENVDQAESVAKKFSEDPLYAAQVPVLPTRAELADAELKRLIEVEVLNQQIEQYGIEVSDADVDDVYTNSVLAQAQGQEAEVEKTLDELYGWTVQDFKDNVIREVVMREKLQEYITDNEPGLINGAARTQLEEIKAQLDEDPTLFAELAAQYSDDGSAADGGDLGYFGRGVMVAEFEEAAFGLTEVNQVSEIVETQFGLHLIQLVDTKAADEATGEDEQIQARHILIATSVNEYIQTQVDASDVTVYVKGIELPEEPAIIDAEAVEEPTTEETEENAADTDAESAEDSNQ